MFVQISDKQFVSESMIVSILLIEGILQDYEDAPPEYLFTFEKTQFFLSESKTIVLKMLDGSYVWLDPAYISSFPTYYKLPIVVSKLL